MSDFIVQGNNYVSNSVSISRNIDEQIGVVSGNNSYSVLSNFISDNITYVDSFIERTSQFIGDMAVTHMLDKQYYNSKNSWLQNAVKRNVYINPIEEQKNSMERQAAYTIAALGSEVVLKCGTRYVANKVNDLDIFNFYYNIYSFLDFFVSYELTSPDDNTIIELKKIRSSFDLTSKQKKKIETKTIEKRVDSIAKLDLDFVSDLTSEAKMGLSYLLYTLAAAKYPDDQLIDKSLMRFYDILGYSSQTAAKNIIELNRNSYNTILDNQHKMIQTTRAMINHIGRVMIDFPTVNVNAIMQRGQEIANNDPFNKRRKIVQSAASKGAKIGTSLGFGLLYSKYPQIAMVASSEAFSQFDLNNPQMLEIGSKLLNDWVKDSKTEDQIIAKSKDIKKEAIDLN